MTKDDLFTVLYKSNTQNYMFSGEVHDAVKPYIVSTLTDYYEVSSYILASLNAQKKLLSADFDASRINDPNLRKQYESFRNAESTIDDMIIYVQKSMNARQLSVNIAGTPRRFNKTVGALLFAVLMRCRNRTGAGVCCIPGRYFRQQFMTGRIFPVYILKS